jgi:hypothetical protein
MTKIGRILLRKDAISSVVWMPGRRIGFALTTPASAGENIDQAFANQELAW